MAELSGTFEMRGWDEQVMEGPADGPRVAAATMTVALAGDLEGEATARWHLAYGDSSQTPYVGVWTIRARLGGRDGTVLVRDVGFDDETAARGTWMVVPGTGTGGLAELAGGGRYEAGRDGAATWSLGAEAGAIPSSG